MMKACPKAYTCPFWDRGVFFCSGAGTHLFPLQTSGKVSQALLYRARQHPLPCGTTCSMVSSITLGAQSCLLASPQRSLPSWLSFSPLQSPAQASSLEEGNGKHHPTPGRHHLPPFTMAT